MAEITYSESLDTGWRRVDMLLTFRAEGVIFSMNTIIPWVMPFSSRMPRNLQTHQGRRGRLQLSFHNTLSHGLDCDVLLVGEKNKYLVGGVILMVREKIKSGSTCVIE